MKGKEEMSEGIPAIDDAVTQEQTDSSLIKLTNQSP